jgi:hypothetical protein
MMNGYLPSAYSAPPARIYSVERRDGGWSVVLNGAGTRPIRSRIAAQRIARTLQRQADQMRRGE